MERRCKNSNKRPPGGRTVKKKSSKVIVLLLKNAAERIPYPIGDQKEKEKNVKEKKF